MLHKTRRCVDILNIIFCLVHVKACIEIKANSFITLQKNMNFIVCGLVYFSLPFDFSKPRGEPT